MEIWDPEVIALNKIFEEEGNQGGLCSKKDTDPLFDDESGIRLLMAFLSAQSPESIKKLLRGLFTENQINQAKKVLIAAQMLNRGDQYANIQASLNLTPRRVAMIAKKLKSIPGFLSPEGTDKDK